ncbi:MAG: hypothetical protein WKG00_13890 [Polyangiaceae bacterium]
MRPLPWDRAADLPWHVFTSPLAKWEAQPSFVVGEVLFIGCAAAALLHALRQGDERRKHVLVWVAALLAGTANDLFFMALPLVDNFWQAQAMVMITPRLPLYIPCVYVCFMYFPTVSVWRMNLRALPRAAASGLAALAFYAPYDIVGARFLWWTWHDTDRPIAHRILGAPMGSSMFILTFVAAFAFLIGRTVDHDPAVGRRTVAKGLLLACGLSTLAMMVQMTVLQQLDGGVPGIRGLLLTIVLFAVVAFRGLRRTTATPPRAVDRILGGALAVYFATLVGVLAVFDPARHRSESFHQTYGACHVEATDITGARRYEFICAEDYDEDFSFDCGGPLPADGTAWYTVCGKPDPRFATTLVATLALAALGALAYASLLGVLRRGRVGQA